MKGTRALTNAEAEAVMEAMTGRFKNRDRATFAMEYYTGERISAILQLTIGHVVQNGRIVESIYFDKQMVKGKGEGHRCALHAKVRALLAAWINELSEDNVLTASDFVFKSRKGQKAISRVAYHYSLTAAKDRAGLTGRIASHSARKSFARNVYEASGHNIITVMKALHHKQVQTTMNYLAIDEEELQTIILALP